MGKALGTIGGIAGGTLGAIYGGPAGAMAGYSLGSGIGGALGGGSSISGQISGANSAQQAANAAAGQQRLAAQMGSFRPVGMTTAFGTSNFETAVDPNTGLTYIKNAGYTAAPQLASLQNQLMGGYGAAYNQAQDISNAYSPMQSGASQLFNLGQQYLSTSPEAAAQSWITNQRALLAPKQEQDLAALRNQTFRTGRTGLATGGTSTGMMATNPEMAAYYNAKAMTENQLAAQADQYGMQRLQFGAGLFGTGGSLLDAISRGRTAAYSPLQTQLGLSNAVEGMSQQPYNLGLQLGAAQIPGQQMGVAGLNNAALMQYGGAQQAANINSSFLSNLIGSAAGGMSSGGGTFGALGGKVTDALGNMLGNPLTAMQYGTNIGSEQTRMIAAQNAGL